MQQCINMFKVKFSNNNCSTFSQVNIYIIENTVVLLIRPPYLQSNCGHVREVAFGQREK